MFLVCAAAAFASTPPAVFFAVRLVRAAPAGLRLRDGAAALGTLRRAAGCRVRVRHGVATPPARGPAPWLSLMLTSSPPSLSRAVLHARRSASPANARVQTDTSTAPDSLLVLADPTASNLIQVGKGASGAVLREPDVASLVTRLMGVDSPLAATRSAATPLPSGNVFVRPTASVIAVLDGVDKKLSEQTALLGASAQTYALQRSSVGTVASATQRVVPSLLFGDDSGALRAAYPSALVVCGAAAQSEACAEHAGARAEASFSDALLERAAPLAATFGDAVAFGPEGTLVSLRDGGATLDMAQPAQRAVVDELLQLAAMADAVAMDSKAALAEDAAPALFVLHFSALGALRGDAAHAAAEAFTAALLPVVLAQVSVLYVPLHFTRILLTI